jgi:hypothetical protein
MATIYVTEFSAMGGAIGGPAQIAARPGLAKQSMAITASSTTLSSVFTAQTRFIRVHTDAICSIAIGKTPVAVATYDRMSAESTEYYGVVPGDNLAVITNT